MKKQTKEEKKKIDGERITITLNKIIELFKTGDVPKAISIVTFPPYKNIPSNKWSLANRLIMAQNDTSDGRGFNQWLQIGRRVCKGAKAFHILAPKMVKRKKKEEDDQENTENESKEEPEFRLIGFTPIPIFKFEDTTGENLDYEKHELPDLPLLDKAREWGIDVGTLAFHGRFYGYYKSGSVEKIRLASPSESVFFHELAHAAHKRVKGKLKNGQCPKQEIVAELSAQVLAQLVGTELESTLGNSYEYISRYAKDIKKDIGLSCLGVLSEVEQVLKLILEV